MTVEGPTPMQPTPTRLGNPQFRDPRNLLTNWASIDCAVFDCERVKAPINVSLLHIDSYQFQYSWFSWFGKLFAAKKNCFITEEIICKLS